MHKLALSIDVEDWFHVRNMMHTIQRRDWDQCNSRIEHGMQFILQELQEHDIKATFFILGWVAEQHPDLVRTIHEYGHEIATHGYSHKPLDLMTQEEYRSDLGRSIEILQGLVKTDILGFRAPSFSIMKETMWAFEIMRSLGIRYDSSVFPISHPDYGIRDFGCQLREIDGVVEVPMTVLPMGPLNIPVPGGGYFRLFPLNLSRRILKHQLRRGPSNLYFHPWEFDADQPRVRLPFLKYFRHYVGLEKNRQKFSQILKVFPFTTLRELAFPDGRGL